MSAEAALRLSARLPSQYLDGKHIIYWVGDMNDMAAVALWAAASATQAAASASAAAASLAAQQALGLATNGVGNEPMDLPRMSMFSGDATRPWDIGAALVVNVQDATYQITEHDTGKLLITTSGTRTWTLPLGTDVWVGWRTALRNRSGNNLTLARTGADTINGAGSNLTIATSSAILSVVCTGATSFEVA